MVTAKRVCTNLLESAMSEGLFTRELKPEAIDQTRRRLCSTAAMTIAAAQRRMIASATDAGLLNVRYAEDGPSDDPPVVLLRGWPQDIHRCVDLAPLRASKEVRK